MSKQMLKGKVSIITGASSGIGRATAELFAEEGASVVLTGINQAELNEVVEGIRAKGQNALGILADVTDAGKVPIVFQQAIDQFGDIDILINNAGIVDGDAIDEVDDETMQKVFDVNYFGPSRYVREALKYLLPKDNGVIINITSVNGEHPINGVAYAASKGALNVLTHNVAIRLSETNIRINAVAPGTTMTPMHMGNLEDTNPGGTLQLDLGKNYVNWEVEETDPIDQANACLYLASDMGRKVKGQILTVDNAGFL